MVAGAAGLPYVIRSSAIGADGTIAPSNRITMGAIGVGGMGMGDLNGFLNKSEVRMLAVCDVDDNHANRRQADGWTRSTAIPIA